jgi:hypothetical protein
MTSAIETYPLAVSLHSEAWEESLWGHPKFTLSLYPKFILDILDKCLYFGKNPLLIDAIRVKSKAFRMENLGDRIRDEGHKHKLTIERPSERTNLLGFDTT